MIKMYNVEVLSKFPVVQHFPFGSLFSWDKDPNAKVIATSIHASSHPQPSASAPTARVQRPLRDPLADDQAQHEGGESLSTRGVRGLPVASSRLNNPTRAPWVPSAMMPPHGEATCLTGTRTPQSQDRQPSETITKAPWARTTR